MKKSTKDSIMLAKRRARDKVCAFCKSKAEITWQDYEKLKEYLSPRSRIMGAQFTGVCAKHQRKMTRAIKQARHLALLPFVTK